MDIWKEFIACEKLLKNNEEELWNHILTSINDVVKAVCVQESVEEPEPVNELSQVLIPEEKTVQIPESSELEVKNLDATFEVQTTVNLLSSNTTNLPSELSQLVNSIEKTVTSPVATTTSPSIETTSPSESSNGKLSQTKNDTSVNIDTKNSPQLILPMLISSNTIPDIDENMEVQNSSLNVSNEYCKPASLTTPATASKKYLSLGSSSTSSLNKLRPFASTERLGGVSRLASLTNPSSNLKSRAGSKLNRISEKRSVISRASKTSTVLAEKEHISALKQQTFVKKLEERDERLRAFQEIQKQKLEARKKANEERIKAVLNRAQQMKFETQQQQYQHQPLVKTVIRKPVEILNKLKGKENVLTSTSIQKPVTTKLHPSITLCKIDTTQAVTHPGNGQLIKSSQPPCNGNTNHSIQSKVLTTISKPIPLSKNQLQNSTSCAQNNTYAPGNNFAKSQAPTIVSKQIVNKPQTPVVDESFNISMLGSDSESEDEKPNHRIPAWSRKGNSELITSISNVYANKLKWQQEFLPASYITFDIKEIFRNYHYTERARTSSGIWNTPSALQNSCGRTVLKRILI